MARNRRLSTIIVACCLCFFYFCFVRSTETKIAKNESLRDDPHHYHYRKVPRGEYLYEFPAGTPRGIVFVAHGCSHSATDWFPPSPHCPQCLGLPEERSLVRAVLEHRFIALSISSQNRMNRCWRAPSDSDPVRQILVDFKKEHHIESLPVYAFGASSGGSFVGSMAIDAEIVSAVNLKGVVVQISTIGLDPDKVADALAVPVLFVPMTRDLRTLHIVQRQIEFLKKSDPGSLSAICQVGPIPIDPLFFHHRIGGKLTAEISQKIYGALKQNGYLDAEGLVVEDPRRSSWRDIVAQSAGLQTFDGLKADESAISEEMNVAFSMHELTSQCNEEMMRFILSIEENTK